MSKGKSLGILVSLVIIANTGNLQLVTSSGNDFTVADFYNETTVSRIAFGSCRYIKRNDEHAKWRHPLLSFPQCILTAFLDFIIFPLLYEVQRSAWKSHEGPQCLQIAQFFGMERAYIYCCPKPCRPCHLRNLWISLI